MPTPTVSDVYFDGYERAITKKSPNRGVGLPTWANRMNLLRTPTASEASGGPVLPAIAREKNYAVMLRSEVADKENWANFSDAIKRWEQVTNSKAPEPTVADGQKGQHRLSAKFTEWLMGLPVGWITNHGLSRREEIKMAGNGVVPQQAKLALEILMHKHKSAPTSVVELLPTPTTMDAKASNTEEVVSKFLQQGKQTCLTYAITELRREKKQDV